MLRRFTHFRDDRTGSVAVEFALLVPVLLGLMLGIMQIGIGMQNYNALRAISADTARYAVIDAQASMARKTDAELKTWAENRATGPIYHLNGARLTVTVAPAATQRVPGANEKTITISYTISSMADFIGMRDMTIQYSRPIFLMP